MSLPEILNSASTGDKDAIAVLLYNIYGERLRSIALKMNITDDDRIEDYISDFYRLLVTPTQKNEWRLRNICTQGNPEAYLARAFNNFLLDAMERENRLPQTSSLDPNRTGDISDDADDKNLEEIKIEALLDTLENCSDFQPRTRYILLTYLISQKYLHEGPPLKLSEKLAQQLGMTPTNVYNTYTRALTKLKEKAAEALRRQYNKMEL